MDSTGLPTVPDLDEFSPPVRYGILALLAAGPLLFGVLVFLGGASSPPAVVEAAPADAPQSDAEVIRLATFSEESPIRTASEAPLDGEPRSVETTVETVQSGAYPGREFYVTRDGEYARLTIRTGR
jgi:hypothetical protein